MAITAGIFLILFLAIYGTAAFWVNWWWFGSMGHRSVLTTRYVARGAAFLIGGLAAALFVWGNLVLALRRSAAVTGELVRGSAIARLIRLLVVATGAIVLVTAGSAASSRWDTWLLALHGRSFGVKDPVFGRDAGFYVFALPAWNALRAGAVSVMVATLVAVAVIYIVRLGVRPRDYRNLPRGMRVHLFTLGGLLLLLIAIGYWLSNFELSYSTRGVVYGASYTDVNAQRWANYALTAVTALAAIVLVLNAFARHVRWLVALVLGWAVLAVALGIAYPSIVQKTVVEPSELRRERPFIEHNLAMTRQAYDLDSVTQRNLNGQGTPNASQLAAQPATINNIRLWDYRVIKTTYQQIQSFVPYYVFNDVDVDRYILNGQLRQVLISARELDTAGLPATAQTWVNRHLVYTHGYGVVASPVEEVSAQGLPSLLIGNIPPNGQGPLAITRPEIYFGEKQADWVAVGTGQEEFTGLQGAPGTTDRTRYAGAGKGALRLSNYGSRIILATYLRDRTILLSGALDSKSRLLIRQNVRDRAKAIAPFLTYDPDPYIVLLNGRLVWILDAYTSTDRYPDATPTRGLNYMRNSVKVVVDAYDGTTTFYRTGVSDPMADAYASIYPDLFKPLSEAPAGLAAHFRYPELLFDVQSEIYATYHVSDPAAYYNGDDKWAIATEQVADSVKRMEPYYVTLMLPQEQDADFTLILPFTPAGSQNRQNMTSWMAARTDADGRQRLVVYRFPRQTTVFGPRQIEARINQEPDISAQITLWNQSGSTVIRGNLLVIPIGESMLYVQPLYLQASDTEGALPELKRVIVGSSDRVVMRPTLPEALSALTAGQQVATGPPEPASPSSGSKSTAASQSDLARRALESYQRAQDALTQGDWATYGKAQAEVESLLEQLAGTPTAGPSTPVPAATPNP